MLWILCKCAKCVQNKMYVFPFFNGMNFLVPFFTGEQTIKTNHLKISQNRKGSSSEEAYSEPHIAKNLLPKQKVYHQAKGQPIVFLKCESSGNPKPTITWYKVIVPSMYIYFYMLTKTVKFTMRLVLFLEWCNGFFLHDKRFNSQTAERIPGGLRSL